MPPKAQGIGQEREGKRKTKENMESFGNSNKKLRKLGNLKGKLSNKVSIYFNTDNKKYCSIHFDGIFVMKSS